MQTPQAGAAPRAVLGSGAGASTLRGQQRHRNVPNAGCLCPGLAGGCGGGGAHRPCSSSRKLNERKGHPPPQSLKTTWKMQICLSRGLGDGSAPGKTPQERFFGKENDPSSSPACPGTSGRGAGNGQRGLPLAKERPQRPGTNNTTKQMKNKTNQKKQKQKNKPPQKT